MANLKMHKKLKIKKWELESLLKTRAILASEKVRNARHKGKTRLKGALFDIGNSGESNYASDRKEEYNCGTVACIGGWMRLLKDEGFCPTRLFTEDETRSATLYVNDPDSHSEPLHGLFFPPIRYNWNKITAADAVVAIDKFLETGKADWSHVEKKAA